MINEPEVGTTVKVCYTSDTGEQTWTVATRCSYDSVGWYCVGSSYPMSWGELLEGHNVCHLLGTIMSL